MSDIKPELVLEIWEHFKDFVPAKERQIVTYSFIEKLEDYGFDVDTLSAIEGEDRYIDKVYLEKSFQYNTDNDED